MRRCSVAALDVRFAEDEPPQKRRERLAHSSGVSTSIFVMLHSWRRGTWGVTVSSERTAKLQNVTQSKAFSGMRANVCRCESLG